jgi:hypothetical protein
MTVPDNHDDTGGGGPAVVVGLVEGLVDRVGKVGGAQPAAVRAA